MYWESVVAALGKCQKNLGRGEKSLIFIFQRPLSSSFFYFFESLFVSVTESMRFCKYYSGALKSQNEFCYAYQVFWNQLTSRKKVKSTSWLHIDNTHSRTNWWCHLHCQQFCLNSQSNREQTLDFFLNRPFRNRQCLYLVS